MSKHCSKLYSVWKGMRQRCSNKKHIGYKNYGGRGISICVEWNDYKKFNNWALSHGYEEGLTIERKDNNKGYCPENCIWVSRAIQNKNQRTNINITAWGETKILKDWSRDPRCNVGYAGLFKRIKEGMSPEQAIIEPSKTPKKHDKISAWGEIKGVVEWSKDERCVVTVNAIIYRLNNGVNPEDAISKSDMRKS